MSTRRIVAGLHAMRKTLQRLMSLCPLSRPRPPRRLRLCENLQLGERRFLSVVEFGQQKFLVGGTANSLAMLAVLPRRTDFQEEREDLPVWKSVNGELVREGEHG
jgi:flagellar biogenesis protein FliO